MSSTVSTTVGNMVVVTHVHPANANANGENTQKLVGVQRFLAGRPQALGTIQIIVGLMIFLFGISMTLPYPDTLGVYSGIFVWGALFYVTAGSLTVAAARRPSRCLVNCAMAFSIVTVVTAITAVTLYALDAAGIVLYCNYYDDGGYWRNCYQYMTRVQGVSGVLAVFNLLQLIVSAVVIGYSCKATCCCAETPSVIVVPAESVVTGQTAAPYTGEIHNFKGEASAMIPPHPPAYNAVVN